MIQTSVTALHEVQSRINSAVSRCHRQASEVTLVAVSKTFPVEAIRPLLDAGQRVFGENRVQEAQAKWPELRQHYDQIELHLIGPLQTNKAAQAVALFDVIQTIDRRKIAEAIALTIQKQAKAPTLFVQVNTGSESQKAGLMPDEADRFIEECRTELGLTISGLMCIPPVTDSPAKHFSMLAAIAKTHGLAQLSMGMSADYEAAITHGATHVRVGSAIFGTR
jgi:PLP dependent protein